MGENRLGWKGRQRQEQVGLCKNLELNLERSGSPRKTWFYLGFRVVLLQARLLQLSKERCSPWETEAAAQLIGCPSFPPSSDRLN